MKSFEKSIGHQKITIETNSLAEQAAGSCVLKVGDNTFLSTAERGEEEKELGFFPLTCSYEERYYAAGEILGSRFLRREGKPTTRAVLVSRIVDRAIRPLFPDNFMRETQVIPTCLSWDEESDPSVLALLATSVALGISDIPWGGPVAAVKISKLNGEFVINSKTTDSENSEFNMILSAVEENGEVAANMIEIDAKEVPEETAVEAFEFAKGYLKELLEFQKEIIKETGKEKIAVKEKERDEKFEEKIKKDYSEKIKEAVYSGGSSQKKDNLKKLKQEIKEKIESEMKEEGAEVVEEKIKTASEVFEKEEKRIIRDGIIKEGKRPDGRDENEIRQLQSEVGILPRVHGSGMFTRGQTKALSVLTLGAPGDYLIIEGMEISEKRRFFHHYNFPPYSVGEVRRLGAPGRREIGHGMLAEKAIAPLIPDFEKFPYTIRVTTEILSSNGSTSMASVSGISLCLMDGGVPLKSSAAGIAMGLIKEGEEFKVLTDIQGLEDHSGDMDFKVAGSAEGMTALQMDVKIRGIGADIMKEALRKAKEARVKILETMEEAIESPRSQVSSYAPKIAVLKIEPEKIGMVIGSGGKTIDKITEEFGVSIDIEEDGQVFISGDSEESVEKARAFVENITREPKPGEKFEGKVTRIFNFGAMVEILPGKEGLVHISKFSDERIGRVEDVVSVGDIIPVKVVEIDEQGRINLSAKDAGFKPKK